jgi:hypothetical protein
LAEWPIQYQYDHIWEILVINQISSDSQQKVMKTLLFDPPSWDKYVRSKNNHECITWHAKLASTFYACAGSEAQIKKATLSAILEHNTVLFAWNMSPILCLYLLVGRPVVYLYWGSSHLDKPAYRLLLRWIFLVSRKVIVNDAFSQKEVWATAGVKAKLLPFYADESFFIPSISSFRSAFILCNGTSGRDVDKLMTLANSGYQVVWVATGLSQKLISHAELSGIKVMQDVDPVLLRSLYQSCACFVMPISEPYHPAGQTTSLEACLCHAPVFVTDSKTSDALAQLEFPCYNLSKHATGRDWKHAIDKFMAHKSSEYSKYVAPSARARIESGISSYVDILLNCVS